MGTDEIPKLPKGWFPAAVDISKAEIDFRKLSLKDFESAPFHDGRVNFFENSHQQIIPFDDLLKATRKLTPSFDRIILHQSFCGSTFLAHVLTVPGATVSYREPQALIQIAEELHPQEQAGYCQIGSCLVSKRAS